MFDWLLYHTPYWLWLAPAVVGGVGLFLFAVRFLGLRNAIGAAIGFIAIIAAGLARVRGRQEGWKDRIKKENRDAEAIIKRINRARSRTRNADPDRLYDDDGFKRK